MKDVVDEEEGKKKDKFFVKIIRVEEEFGEGDDDVEVDVDIGKWK